MRRNQIRLRELVKVHADALHWKIVLVRPGLCEPAFSKEARVPHIKPLDCGSCCNRMLARPLVLGGKLTAAGKIETR